MGATHKIWSGPTYNFAIVDSNALFTWGEGINQILQKDTEFPVQVDPELIDFGKIIDIA